MKRLLFLAFTLTLASLAQATVSIEFLVGQLTDASGNFVADGSTVELISLGSSGIFTAPSPVAFTTGTEQVIATFPVQSGTTGGTPGSFDLSFNVTLNNLNLATNQQMALVWFPTITTPGSGPGVGTSYGVYTDGTLLVPIDGSTGNLFTLATTTVGGALAGSALQATLTVSVDGIWNGTSGSPLVASNWNITQVPLNNAQIDGGGSPALAGGAWSLTGALDVGVSSTGSLNVSNGGNASFGSVVLGLGAGSSGTLTISGAGSVLTASSNAVVGNSGAGALQILNGADFEGVSLSVGTNAGSAGTVVVNGAGSVLHLTQGLFVGANGTGSLTLTNGGTVNLGAAGPGNGAVNVNPSATLGGTGTIAALVVVGAGGGLYPAAISGSGGSTLTITGGLTLHGGSSLEAFVGTTSSLIQLTGGALSGPESGTVFLNLDQAPNFASGTYTLLSFPGIVPTGLATSSFVLANAPGGFNFGVQVATNSISISAQPADVSSTATGSPLVAGNWSLGLVPTVSAQIDAGASPVLAGGFWNMSGELDIGVAGSGSLNVTNAGSVTVGSLVLGLYAGGSGTLTVTGSVATLNAGSLIVGNNGTGSMTIAGGGAVSVSGALVLGGPAGTLNLNSGGTLQAGSISTGGGGLTMLSGVVSSNAANYNFNWNGGTIVVGAGGLFTSVNATLGAGTSSTLNLNGSNAAWTGVLSGAGALVVAAPGTLTVSTANSYTGGTTIDNGTVVVANLLSPFGHPGGTVVVNGGTMSVGTGVLNYSFGGTGGTMLATGNVILGSLTDPLGFNYTGTVNLGSHTVGLDSAATATVGTVLMGPGAVLNSNHGIALIPGGTLTATGSATVNDLFYNLSIGGVSATIIGPDASNALSFTGNLEGGGNLQGNIRVLAGFNPGDNSGTPDGGPTITSGTLSLAATNTTTLSIGGLTPVTSYDQIGVGAGGHLVLQGGTLAVALEPDPAGSTGKNTFVPEVGNSFTLINVTSNGTVTGSFGVIDFSHAVLSSTLLGWDTSQIYTNGSVSVDLANYFWTGTDSNAWVNGDGTMDLGNFTATNSAGSPAQTNNLFSFSNVFLSMTGAANATAQTLGGGSFTVNSLNFIAGSNTLSGGGGTLTLSAANAYQDQNHKAYAAGIGLVMQAGAASATLDTDLTIVLGGSQIWEIDSAPAQPLTVNGSIVDNFNTNSKSGPLVPPEGLTKTGAGTLVFNDNGANNYIGGTNVAGGTLFLMTGATLGESTGLGTLTMSGGTLDLGGTAQLVNGLSFSSGVIQDSVTGGSLTVNTGSSSVANTALSTNATRSAIVVTTPAGLVGTISTGLVDGTNVISGDPAAAALTMLGAGTVVLSGANSYSGGTTINAGTVQLAGLGILGDPAGLGGLTIDGGTLDLGGTVQVVNSLSLTTGTVTDGVGGGQLTALNGVVVTGAGTSTLAAVVAGPGGLVKSGTGLLNVLADELYAGITDVQAGDVQLTQGDLGGGGAVTVDSGGTLSGTGTVSGGVTVASGGRLAPGAVGTGAAGRLTVGSATLSSGSGLSFNLDSIGGAAALAGTAFSQLQVTGALNFNSLTANSVTLTLSPVVANNLLANGSGFTWSSIISAGSVIGSFASNDFQINSTAFAPGTTGTFALVQNGLNPDNFDLTFAAAAIPEPATVALFAGLGVLGLAVLRRRR